MPHLAISICLLAIVSQAKRGGVIVNEHTLTASQTRRRIEVLGKWFDFIGLEELPLRLLKPGHRPFCLLTFDDGKRSNFTQVAPELERKGVPAVFYVTTEYLTHGRPLWFDRQKALVRALGHCPPGLELEVLKRLPFADLMARLNQACERNGIEPDAEPDDDVRPMTWDEARSLKRRGFVIGAHGRTHAILTRETPERAFAEIEGSLAEVSSELGAPCRTFAFPNGNHTAALAQHALQCGATTVMTTDPTWADGSSCLGQLPRIQLFPGFTRVQTEFKLAVAAFPGTLRNPDGSGRAYRTAAKRYRSLQPEPLTSRKESAASTS